VLVSDFEAGECFSAAIGEVRVGFFVLGWVGLGSFLGGVCVCGWCCITLNVEYDDGLYKYIFYGI